jgi:hypothetical protein
VIEQKNFSYIAPKKKLYIPKINKKWKYEKTKNTLTHGAPCLAQGEWKLWTLHEVNSCVREILDTENLMMPPNGETNLIVIWKMSLWYSPYVL